ncbi:cytochrome c oxidase subunit 3 [Paramagnetospirillum magneticum]|uniref:Heme/copper-type cytochrome/quinol oxidase, subunit 3 n=1 Tax=Paramagnetospirillum magneticum (strain ATCC 700264 / AMB-1) TaxID=342108 RepID=Q2W330_PARM1|nr:cytochrome c oxidase subunit 3 [Paramagnetospirillum magneticum]BAE51745.1 Heme/copper-type cytochrome/quinol oxidase, subunit 3 [Paramagnetospirillum magneticum AMB-1]
MSDESENWGALSDLPGNPLMWVLILSELLVFGAFFAAFSVSRVLHPAMFLADQLRLDRLAGGVNTMLLLTSGLAAALAVNARAAGDIRRCRLWLGGAALLGLGFLGVKFAEYADKAAQGFGIESDTFWTLFYLMTGFHAAHVILGLVILGIVAAKPSRENVETGAAFWHMVDLIWVLLYPIVYLIR